MKKVLKFWKWKCFHPFSQWECLKRKPKPEMVLLEAGTIAAVLHYDNDLYEEVTDLINEMEEDEEEEEEEFDELQEELDEITGDLDEIDKDFATEMAEQLGPVNSSYEIPVELENMVGASTSTSSITHDLRTTREKFEDESG